MSNSDEQWWEAQCGEYVLGTLRGAERDVIEKILLVDEDVRSRVEYWEQNLAALDIHMRARQVPAHVLPRLMKKIRSYEQQKSETGKANIRKADAHAERVNDLTGTWTEDIDSVLASEGEEKTRVAEEYSETLDKSVEQHPEELFKRPVRHNRFWKLLALLSSAATLALAALLLRQTTPDVDHWAIPESGSLSFLQDDKRQTLWFMSLSNDAQQVAIMALTPPPLQPDQSHQLWVVKPDGAGVSSVGLLPRNPGESSSMQLAEPISPASVFAVSLEPATGSPEPLPTGPVLFSADIQPLEKSSQ